MLVRCSITTAGRSIGKNSNKIQVHILRSFLFKVQGKKRVQSILILKCLLALAQGCYAIS